MRLDILEPHTEEAFSEMHVHSDEPMRLVRIGEAIYTSQKNLCSPNLPSDV